MKKQERESLDAYYAVAGSWAHDREDTLRWSRRIAWIVAGAAALVAVCEAVALVVLMPLKTVQPYTLMVDRQTGFVQALKPIEAQQISADAALTQSFLVQYVIAREGFDIASVQSDYRKVALWSAGTARARYLADMQAGNVASPLSLYPRSTVIDVQVKSVTAIGERVAMIRFDTQRRDAAGAPALASHWVAVIRYSFSGEPMKAADRYINPLGFQVAHYRRSAETLPAAEPAPAVVMPQGPVATGPQGYPRVLQTPAMAGPR